VRYFKEVFIGSKPNLSMKTFTSSLLSLLLLLTSTITFGGPNEDLVAAINEQDTDKLKAALDAGADPNYQFEHYLLWQLNRTKFEKFTPLMLASATGYYDGVLYLLHSKVKVNATANGGSSVYFGKVPVKSVKNVTALHLAAGNGHIEVVKLLMIEDAHVKIIMMEVNAQTSSAANKFPEFLKGVATFPPKNWAKANNHGDIVELWKGANKAQWKKDGLPPVD